MHIFGKIAERKKVSTRGNRHGFRWVSTQYEPEDSVLDLSSDTDSASELSLQTPEFSKGQIEYANTEGEAQSQVRPGEAKSNADSEAQSSLKAATAPATPAQPAQAATTAPAPEDAKSEFDGVLPAEASPKAAPATPAPQPAQPAQSATPTATPAPEDAKSEFDGVLPAEASPKADAHSAQPAQAATPAPAPEATTPAAANAQPAQTATPAPATPTTANAAPPAAPKPTPAYVENFTEPAAERGAKLEGVKNADVLKIFALIEQMPLDEAMSLLERDQKSYAATTYIVNTCDSETMASYESVKPRPQLICNRRKLDSIKHIDALLAATNKALRKGGYFGCHARTSGLKRLIVKHKYPWGINYFMLFMHDFWHQFFAYTPFLRRYYLWKSNGRDRNISRVEVLGRISRAGFEIAYEGYHHGEFFVLGRKVREPITGDSPSYTPIIKLQRVGKDGTMMGVYKVRTMYPYSEYLQSYVYAHDGLQEGGKFKNDYRVSRVGHFLRKTWLDELPMLVNVFIKRNMKLVGVRPLSRHYFSLYTPEMQALRIKVKPGLIPPFYYERETPKTIQDVQESERRYIEAYLQHPFATDQRYFWGSVFNIIFRRKHSE